MRRLIVTADDVGLHPGMTEGAIRAHREGIVTACSLVATGAAFDDAVARLRELPSLEAGVHLTLVEERPLTNLRFPKKYTSFVPLYLARAISIDAIERELRAQIERVLASDLRVTHLNGHQHLHLLPRIFDVVVRLAREFAVGYVRIVDDRGSRARRVPIALLSALGRRARVRGGSNDRTIGVADAGHLSHIAPLLEHVDGVTELVTHPGIGVDGYGWGYDWDAETRALCDPRLRHELASRGIELVAPSHIESARA
ncbi:MAG: ChbG/HpnK family deacetylase [Acidobacteria bacterium]|nr:ChbG/HpnK family deacetylase [Acidobacteriota bacterium]MBV9476852.1 ChbG/HpnK family deacetylase [Acidobacteriota bacterium]